MARSPWPGRAGRPLLAPRPGLTCPGPAYLPAAGAPRRAALTMILAEPEAVAAARTSQSLAGRACRVVPVAARCRVPRRLSSGMERQVWLLNLLGTLHRAAKIGRAHV